MKIFTKITFQFLYNVCSIILVKANKIDTKRTFTFLWGDEISSTRRYIEENNGKNTTIQLDQSIQIMILSFQVKRVDDIKRICTVFGTVEPTYTKPKYVYKFAIFSLFVKGPSCISTQPHIHLHMSVLVSTHNSCYYTNLDRTTTPKKI